MPEAEIIAFHGWGFDAACWEEWQQQLGKTISFQSSERGYFGKPKHIPIFSAKNIPKIIITHSFGLHVCPDHLFREANLLIIFSGFLHFHPVATQYKRRSKLVLNQMMNRLEGHPEDVLKEFYENTFYPHPDCGRDELPEGELQKQILLKDLRALNTHEIDARMLKSVEKMCILHGFEDAIVPRRKGRELYDIFSRRAQYFEIKNAGHALPFTHGRQCRQFIEPEITELIS